MEEAVVLLSGGIDSAALVRFLQNKQMRPHAFHVAYGQRAADTEMQHSARIAAFFGIPLKSCVVKSDQALDTGEIQGRNAFLIFTALALSGMTGGFLALGIHAGTPYYDCSTAFFKKASALVSEYSDGRIALLAPFLTWTKSEIIGFCEREEIPLDMTYSCEAGTTPPCGKCLSCLDRRNLPC